MLILPNIVMDAAQAIRRALALGLTVRALL